ncbi:MAG: protein-disulfide reductase DsbD family protein [Candidatus Tectimicrobiota bacterium]
MTGTFSVPQRRGSRYAALLCLLLLSFWGTAPAQAEEVLASEHVRIFWLAPQVFAPSPTTIGIHFELQPDWHIYWYNPGDSGAAPRFTFSTEGVRIGAVQWPYPTRLPFMHLTNLGYTDEVTFPVTVEPQPDTTVRLELAMEWLVCKDICIPEFGTLTLQRPVAAHGPHWAASDLAMLEQAQQRVPGPPETAPWQLTSAQLRQGAVHVTLMPAATAQDLPTLFPAQPDLLSPGAPHTERTPQGVEMIFSLLSGRQPPERLQFVMVAGDRAWDVPEVPLRPAVSAATTEPPPSLSLGFVLGAAFVGGLVLNLMPCVFPVLVIKLLALVQTGHAPTRRLHEGLGYTLGVLSTFGGLGALLLALRATGAALGWGFQLQSPVIVLGLIVVFWLMALNFLGVFEWGLGLMSLAGRPRPARPASASSAFLTGMLAVFVAAPCTGPFMGTAIGAAATLPAPAAMAIFLGLGCGLAAPFLAVACFPRATAWVPRAGPWMETLKHACAFPLFATVIWLLWVLGRQTGPEGWLIATLLLLVLSFSLWLGRFSVRVIQQGAWVLALLALLYAGVQIRAVATAQPAPATGDWAAYEPALLQATRANKQSVFVDFTAAWCITCQVNKLTVLDTEAARKLFQAGKVFLMRGDWTTYDSRITEALAAFGRTSVPLYVFYPADGSAPRLLPPLLTLSALETAINN